MEKTTLQSTVIALLLSTNFTPVQSAVQETSPTIPPYQQIFDTETDFNSYTVIDSNGDESTWIWDSDTKSAKYNYSQIKNADDWLISPIMHFEAGKAYKLTFIAKDPYGTDKLEVLLGTSLQPSSFITTIVPITSISSTFKKIIEANITVQQTGNYYLGFHAISEKDAYFLSIDDINIEAGVVANAPAQIQDLKAVPILSNGLLSAEIYFTAPALNFIGETLQGTCNFEIYRETELIKKITNIIPGSPVNFIEEDVVEGTYNYSVIPINTFGKGLGSQYTVKITYDIPDVVTNATLTREGNKLTITWKAPQKGALDGPINPKLLTYTIERNDGFKVVENTDKTTVIDTYATPEGEGQDLVYYKITASNSSGSSKAVQSNQLLIGNPYNGEFTESFSNKTYEKMSWSEEIITGTQPYWTLVNSESYPSINNSQDNDQGFISFKANAASSGTSSRLLSPLLNISKIKNPRLNFYMYHNDGYYATEEDALEVELKKDGQYITLTEAPIKVKGTTGWKKYQINLPALAQTGDIQIVFHGHAAGHGYNVCLDNIYLEDVLDYDLETVEFTVPNKMSVDKEKAFTLTINNKGMIITDEYSISLLKNGTEIANQSGKSLANGEKAEFTFPYIPILDDAGMAITFEARINCEKDENPANNSLIAISNVALPPYPTITNLTGIFKDDKITLSWSNPQEEVQASLPQKVVPQPVTESFEDYDAFTITAPEGWEFVDIDKLKTEEIRDGNYPNSTVAMAFQISDFQSIGVTDEKFAAHEGDKMLICPAVSSSDKNNDDWIISPAITGGEKVSFYAKRIVRYYDSEEFYFCYSTTDTQIESFITLSEKESFNSDTWKLYEYILPADAKYFAIHCTHVGDYALCIDDISYTPDISSVTYDLFGYNIYRDGEKQNENPYIKDKYEDGNIISKQTYKYKVTAVYNKGESAYSNEVTVIAIDPTNIGKENVTALIAVTENNIHINCEAGNTVAIFDITGKNILEKLMLEDNCDIRLSHGFYLVKIGKSVTKVAIK